MTENKIRQRLIQYFASSMNDDERRAFNRSIIELVNGRSLQAMGDEFEHYNFHFEAAMCRAKSPEELEELLKKEAERVREYHEDAFRKLGL